MLTRQKSMQAATAKICLLNLHSHPGHEPAEASCKRAGQQTLLRMFLARWAKRSVLSVSVRQPAAGLTFAIMIVFELPPSESCNIQALRKLLCTCTRAFQWMFFETLVTAHCTN